MAEVRFFTLGCKLNQLETESLADAFRKEGFAVGSWDDPPSSVCLLFVNTCTVTSHAEQKARHVIRKALKDHPLGLAVVTGCYAQMEAGILENDFFRTDGRSFRRVFVFPGERKDGLLDLPAFLAKTVQGFPKNENDEFVFLQNKISEWAAWKAGGVDGSFRFKPLDFTFHSRAFIKIQDGCNNACAFCRVNLARGKSRSRDANDILKDIRVLEEKGFVEAVLTGVNISQYRNSGFDLAGLLEHLIAGTKKIRFRLSSLESGIFDRHFLEVIINTRIRPHFHLSVQSGSPDILGRMSRPGSLDSFETGIAALREAKGDPFLACDIIAGFPGEKDSDFDKTFDFCEKNGFAWIHAFPFSRRPGTAAWNFKDRVSEREARQRVVRLTELALRGKSAYINRWIGKEIEFVPSATAKSNSRYAGGVTENYLKVYFPGNSESMPSAEIQRCKIIGEASSKTEKNFDAEAEIVSIE